MPVILPPGVDPRYWYGGLVAILLACYWVWDECNMQKNEYRAKEKGCEKMHGKRMSDTHICALLTHIVHDVQILHRPPSVPLLPPTAREAERPQMPRRQDAARRRMDGKGAEIRSRSARDLLEIRPRSARDLPEV